MQEAKKARVAGGVAYDEARTQQEVNRVTNNLCVMILDKILMCVQEAKKARAAGEVAYDQARTQQEADRAQASVKAASQDLKTALAETAPPPPEPEPLDKNAVHFKVSRYPLCLSPTSHITCTPSLSLRLRDWKLSSICSSL